MLLADATEQISWMKRLREEIEVAALFEGLRKKGHRFRKKNLIRRRNRGNTERVFSGTRRCANTDASLTTPHLP
jgi:hypothetical protein